MPNAVRDFAERAAGIRLLVLDVDGVLTDGGIVYDSAGREIKAFSVRDGFGIRLWLEAGRQAAVITGRQSAVVAGRCRELGIATVIQGAVDKAPAFRQLLADTRLEPAAVCAMGDDLPDLPLLLASGLGAAPADADDWVRRRAHWVSSRPGGRGAVRELIEALLDAQGDWAGIVARFSQSAG